jgi:hypothetical protein
MPSSKRPIPADVADAFGEALVLLVQWEGGSDETVAILDGRSMNITMIFELVAGRAFRDEVPRSMLELLQTYAARAPERQKEIAVLTCISHTNRRIGAPNQRKLLCCNDFTQIRGAPDADRV